MPNTLLTVSMITKRAVTMFRNTNAFLQIIDRQYDENFRRSDFKIGSSLQLRLPVDYVVGTGQTVTPQSTVEKQRTLVVGTQANVAASFSSQDFALKIDDFADRFLLKMTNDLAAYVAKDVMSAVEGCPNLVSNFDGSGNIISPTQATWLAAGAVLDNFSALRNESRKIIMHPNTNARTVSSISGLFNPQPTISEAFRAGLAFQGTALGFDDWRLDQTVKSHTSGTATTAAVSGGNQTGSTLTISALSGTLKAGDIITIAGVNAVNRLTKDDLGSPMQFVLTADAANGATSLSIYPDIIPPSGGNPVAYQNVTASPGATATITPAVKASVTYRKNVAFRKEAFTLVCADLPLIRNGVVKSARESYDGISLRMVEGFDVLNDIFIDRLDILYGYTMPRPEWAVVVADIQ